MCVCTEENDFPIYEPEGMQISWNTVDMGRIILKWNW
jgi:hypothetical protein